jgi:hypothetical protein
VRDILKEVQPQTDTVSPSLLSTPTGLTMNRYKLNFTIASPVPVTTFVEFSPDGRFLAVGGQHRPWLSILDKSAGFHPTISGMFPLEPTALVWESSETFYVGCQDGCFVHCRINLKDNVLVEGTMNSSLRKEGFPITAMALDAESRTLVVSVGPGVFAFRRVRATSKFQILMNHGGKLIRLEVDSTSLGVSQPASISRENREPRPHHFRGLFTSLPTVNLLSHSAGNI